MGDSVPPPTASVARICLWMLRYPFRRWSWLVAMLATLLVKVGLDLLRPWPMKVLVDYALTGKPLPNTLAEFMQQVPGGTTRENLVTWSVLATVAIFLAGWVLRVATSYVDVGFGLRMTYDLAADLFGHLQRLSLRFHRRKSTGDTVRRVTTDCGSVSTIVKDALLPSLVALVTLAAMFSIMWQLDATLTLLTLAVVPFLVLVFKLYAGPMEERSYRRQEAEGRMYDVVEQTLSSMPVVQAFGREEHADQRFRATASEVLDATFSTSRAQLRFKVLIGLGTAVGTAAILWVGATHALEGSLTVGSILVFISYLGSLYGPIESVMYMSSTVQAGAGSARRVIEVLHIDEEVKNAPDARPLRRVQGRVLLDNVTYGYERGRPALENVTLQAHPGETVAIVGPTGAGKTTLVSLVPRFFDPWSGRVLIDGKDVRNVELQSLRRQIGVVLQDPFLFPMTVAENIAYGHPGASLRRIKAAARAANAHHFIEGLPEKYDTLIGERGATLSGGERQRLSIARALLKDAPVLILDEPTSALDVETEELLLDALKRLMNGRTTFIIAHRLSTIRNADRIAVIKDRRLVENGTHEDLLAYQGVYA
ncbi:MAG: ABC transporter ATP-binding protein/permease, partial [Chloroflexota bacterium]|nr:ABC transporter ATP-binding protein/permease [Chloroflexota bacterium]